MGFIIHQALPIITRERVTQGLVGTHQEHDLPEHILNLVSQSLITIDNTGSPQPNLAQSWEINKEATLYTLKLKKDLKWSDGQALKASDLVLNIPDVQVNVIDDQTIEFKIVDSFSPFCDSTKVYPYQVRIIFINIAIF